MPIVISAHGDGRLVGTAPVRSTTYRSAPWIDEGPISGGWFAAASFEQLCENSVVRRALQKHADAVGTVSLKVHDRRSKERAERYQADPNLGVFAALLRTGMPAGHHRTRAWISFTQQKFGAAYLWAKRSDTGTIVELVPVSPLLISWDSTQGSWQLHLSTETHSVPDRDMLVMPNVLGPNASLRSGVSSLEPLRAMVEADKAISAAVKSWWLRGARPGTVISHPKTLSDKARENLAKSWGGQHAGPENAGRTAILEEGMEVTTLPFDAERSALVDTRNQLWDEACIALDVPPALIHRHDRSTFSNVTELHKSWYREIIAARLRYAEDDWHRLAGMAGVPDALVEYDLDSVLWGTPIERAEVLQKTDHMTVAEKRRVSNLPELPDTDTILVNGAYVPLRPVGDDVSSLVRQLQQVYSSVGTVVSAEEARAILNRGGAGLTGPAPVPAPRAAAASKATAWSRSDADQVLAHLSRAESLGDVDVDKATSGLCDRSAESFGVMVGMCADIRQLRRMVGALTVGEVVE